MCQRFAHRFITTLRRHTKRAHGLTTVRHVHPGLVIVVQRFRFDQRRCGPGIDGAQPLIDAINSCCDGRGDSAYCTQVCTVIATNEAAISFFPVCQ